MTKYTKDFVKDPSAIKDYTVDWSAWLGSDTIATSAWTVPTGITKVSDTTSANTSAIAWLSGGTIQTDYEIYNTITTVGGRTDRAMIKIQVR